MNKTKIEWADHTWNPVTGCRYGCDYCYASRMVKRFQGDVRLNLNDKRHKCDVDGLHILDEHWKTNNKHGLAYPFGFEPTLHRYRMNFPGCYKNQANIFVCSMADLFGEWIPDEWIEEVFEACKRYPIHNYLFLTKNPNRYLKLHNKGKMPQNSNMWYGTTITHDYLEYFCSKEYNTFLSIEPILANHIEMIWSLQDMDWIIIGAESGNRKNKVVPKKYWIDNIVEHAADKVPVFMKDSLIPIVGKENMRYDMPNHLRVKEVSPGYKKKRWGRCMKCGTEKALKDMIAILYRENRGESAKSLGYACGECFETIKNKGDFE